MNEYNRLMDRINKYFTMDDIKYSEEVISAYDLFKILTEKFSELHAIIYNNELKEQMNDFLLSEKKVGKLFKKIIKIQRRKVEYLLTSCKNGVSELSIKVIEQKIDGLYEYHTWIRKDLDSDQLYYNHRDEEIQDLVDFFLSDIEKHLYTIEEFFKLIALENGNIKEVPEWRTNFPQVFSDSFLNIRITYDTYGKVNYDFSIDKSIDPNELFKREWINLECIKEFVNNNAEILLRKIPVRVEELNETSKAIIREYNEKKKNVRKLELNGN